MEKHRNDAWANLSAKVKVFCHKWVECFDIDKARKSLGITREQAAAALRNPIVAGYIDDLVADTRADSILRREWVELQLLAFYDKVNGDEEVPHVTRDGEMVMAKSFNPTAALGALKEIGKISKAYPDGAQGGGVGKVDVNINLQALGIEVEGQAEIVEGEFTE